MAVASPSGKTLHGFIIPLLYHLFEHNETVICGVPQMAMAKDKWRDETRPVIEASRFREFLPIRYHRCPDCGHTFKSVEQS